MKRFINKITLSIAIPVLICHVLFVMVYLFNRKEIQRKAAAISDNYSTVIMGDSQMQTLSPDFFSEAINIASPGEHYYFTYMKLKNLLLNKSHKIKQVLLGLSPHNFSPLFTDHFSLESEEGKSSLQRHLYFFDLFDTEFMRPYQIILRKEFFLGVISGPEWGGYAVYDNFNPDTLSCKRKLRDFFYRRIDDQQELIKQEYYLDQIAELCKKEKISLVFVSNPVHQFYKNGVDEAYYSILTKKLQDHSDALYLDYLNDSVPGIYLNDPIHLNTKGSQIYSEKINAAVTAHLLGKS